MYKFRSEDGTINPKPDVSYFKGMRSPMQLSILGIVGVNINDVTDFRTCESSVYHHIGYSFYANGEWSEEVYLSKNGVDQVMKELELVPGFVLPSLIEEWEEKWEQKWMMQELTKKIDKLLDVQEK